MQSYKIFSQEQSYKLYRSSKKLLISCLLICCVLHIQAQNKKVQLTGNSFTIGEIFNQIEKQTSYNIGYSSTLLDSSRKIILKDPKQTVEQVLSQTLKDTGYTYRIDKAYIFIEKKKSTNLNNSDKPTDAKVRVQQLDASRQKKEIVDINPSAIVLQDSVLGEVPETTTQSLLNSPVNSNFTTEDIRSYADTTGDESETVMAVDTNMLSVIATSKINKRYYPTLAFKSNLLYDLTTTFNLGAELRLSDYLSLDLSVNYNPWTFSDNRKFKHILIQPELRYWIYEPFNGHFLGTHLMYMNYNVGNISLPLNIFPELDDYRYRGDGYGLGFTYGYHWLLSARWSIETSFGFGYMYQDYTKYECKTCGQKVAGSTNHYFGPTKASVSLIYIIK